MARSKTSTLTLPMLTQRMRPAVRGKQGEKRAARYEQARLLW